MTTKAYILSELSMYNREWKKFDDIPEEMFDYLPENLDEEIHEWVSDCEPVYNSNFN